MILGTEVLVLGAGATGLGVAWDCALRGFKTVLLEKGDLAHGTSGRYHGLLHSGARYAVRDRESARDCIAENRILRRIFPGAIEDTGGLFVVSPVDPPEYANPWLAACGEVGIPAEEAPIHSALKDEPLLHPGVSRMFRVPDAACDSFDLLHALQASVESAGGEVYLRQRVERLLVRDERTCGAVAEDLRTGERLTVRAEVVVNCTGAWAGHLAGLAGCPLEVTAAKGTMIAMNSRLVNTVLNRCHPPDDGDIFVPIGTVCVIGTTEVIVQNPDQYGIEGWEVEKLFAEGEALVPRLREFRALRAWAGVRPLFKAQGSRPAAQGGEGDDSRHISRAHAVLDHEARDGVGGLVSVVGGKLTTFRLMAEQATDLVCRKLAVDRPCRTAETIAAEPEGGPRYHVHGRRLQQVEDRGDVAGQLADSDALICECEAVTRGQIEAALLDSTSPILNDLRRDLRLGMGPCQAGFCAYRTIGIMSELQSRVSDRSPLRMETGDLNSAFLAFVQERWKGLHPVMWGANLKQLDLDLQMYRGLLGADRLPEARPLEVYPTERTA